MTRIPSRLPRVVLGALASGLLLTAAGCSGDGGNSGTAASTTVDLPGSAGASVSASVPASASAGDADLSCSGTSCSVTLKDGAQAQVLGTTIRLGSIDNGRATLGVAGHDVSCGQGDSVSAGPLTLRCTTVSDDSVTLTAKLG